MTSTDTLLPCPFCGGEDAEVHDLGDLSAPGAKVVECNCCEAFGPVSRVNAIAAWNRRTPPTPATDTQEESMKLGGGTANGMRALGYQVLPPEPNSDSTCWRMVAPQDRNTEYLAADQAEGWRKAERHWYARNLENVVRLTPPTPSTEEREAVARAIAIIEHCDVSEGVCCCGDEMATHPLVPYVDIRDKFITALEESLNYCREADDCGSIDHEMSRWQEWVKTWPQIADENGGI